MLVGIQEEILRLHSMGLLRPLLEDKTTKANILWATDAYQNLGPDYRRDKEIEASLITGEHSDVIKNRARKALEQQSERTRKHAEVFTPLWICQKMVSHADAVWFGKADAFLENGSSAKQVCFPKRRKWQRYVDARRLEITCGEAPFLVNRYDAYTGEVIPQEQRQGILDRKLRVVRENAATEADWLRWTLRAFQSTYGYEFQGDNLLIARVNLLMTFEEALWARWQRKPTAGEYRQIIRAIVWNAWQMDGLTGKIPYCKADAFHQVSLYEWLGSEAYQKHRDQQAHCRIADWRRKRSLEYLEVNKGGRNMKFDFVIGNPPYQDDRQGNSNTATPIYNSFMDGVCSLSDKAMLITPARFLFNAGYTPKEWNSKMLNDTHLKVIFYAPDSTCVFQGVDIKGGIVITYRDLQKEFGAIKIFSQHPEINQILRKVLNYKDFRGLDTIIVTSFAYHYTKLMYEENPELIGRASKGHDYDIQSNAFSVFPEVFYQDNPSSKECIRILGRDGANRCWKYIQRKYVTHVSNLDSYKAFFAKAAGSGQFGEVLPEAIMGNPGDGATVTFISIGNFDSKIEAQDCVKYTKTKFARALLSVLKVTQDNTPAKWKYVPLQDFTPASDIDWSQSIPDIDRQLYKKYNLDDAEVEFIETHVKEMT